MRPGPRLLQLLGLWMILAVGPAVWPVLEPIWGGAGVVLLVLMLTDSLALRAATQIRVERRVPHSLPLGVWGDVKLRLLNTGDTPVTVEVFDHYPDASETQALPQRLRLPAAGWGEMRYRLLPTARGEHVFGPVQLLLHSPLDIWRRNLHVGTSDEIRVYPNFAAVAKYALLATDNRLSQMGIRKRRRRGEGLEFHQLREYRPGDSLRQIDWKATSRQRKLISREYQAERDQQIFFLIDCGRRMTAKDGELSHFDHTLNSVLLLAYVALRQGDAVGLMSFSGERRYLPPQKGGAAVNTILNTIYDLQPSLQSPDYANAATDLSKRLRKRSLVVIVTNLRDEDSGEILPALSLLRRHHLVLLASLREQIIGAVLKGSVQDFDHALSFAATQRYLLARRKVHDAIVEAGALSLDVEPAQLPISMVNRYLDIKLSGRL